MHAERERDKASTDKAHSAEKCSYCACWIISKLKVWLVMNRMSQHAPASYSMNNGESMVVTWLWSLETWTCRISTLRFQWNCWATGAPSSCDTPSSEQHGNYSSMMSSSRSIWLSATILCGPSYVLFECHMLHNMVMFIISANPLHKQQPMFDCRVELGILYDSSSKAHTGQAMA